MGWPALEKQQHDRLVRHSPATLGGSRPGRQKRRQRQRAPPQGANSEQLAPAHSLAGSLKSVVQKRQHRAVPGLLSAADSSNDESYQQLLIFCNWFPGTRRLMGIASLPTIVS